MLMLICVVVNFLSIAQYAYFPLMDICAISSFFIKNIIGISMFIYISWTTCTRLSLGQYFSNCEPSPISGL